eukprot:CAMPEP_0114496910 /NCGR_PEP_ID=MMETSP0109-20121206/6026_1 /TAXON_ID=29199 /ORGANISM="Chlorarachnion reptans, Strain CCCM449" /LENGTH=255 /DNA_ID=CAMNT_0001674223 /DNA_START=36 /DNA_END=803 /DNA_ORIENTATION=-
MPEPEPGVESAESARKLRRPPPLDRSEETDAENYGGNFSPFTPVTEEEKRNICWARWYDDKTRCFYYENLKTAKIQWKEPENELYFVTEDSNNCEPDSKQATPAPSPMASGARKLFRRGSVVFGSVHDLMRDEWGDTALIRAIRHCDENKVEYILKREKSCLDHGDSPHDDPLTVAARLKKRLRKDERRQDDVKALSKIIKRLKEVRSSPRSSSCSKIACFKSKTVEFLGVASVAFFGGVAATTFSQYLGIQFKF